MGLLLFLASLSCCILILFQVQAMHMGNIDLDEALQEVLGCRDHGSLGSDMQVIVQMLMEIIGSAPDGAKRPLGQTPDDVEVNWLDMSVVNAAEGAALAALLLNMLLELYGELLPHDSVVSGGVSSR